MSLSSHQKWIITIGATSLISLLIGWKLGNNNVQIGGNSSLASIPFITSGSNSQNPDMSRFWQVYNIVKTKYVEKDKVDANKLIEGATAGLVNALEDPYSVYLTPKQNTSATEELQGSFEGIGVQLGFNEDKQLVVISPLKDTPGERAGMRAGDIIWQINDKDTYGISLPEAVDQIKGPKGTKVKLKIQHEEQKELTDVEIVRDSIVVKSVEFEMLENNTIAHVTINRFGDQTRTEWNDVVTTITRNNVKKLILDVRNNPGGYLDTAKYINSDFMEGVVVASENYKGEKAQEQADHSPRLKGVTVVVLINKGSASAAEIVAGALQDRGIAKLVGENSFGKGTVQEVETLSGGAGIHITTAKWLLPSGKWIHKIGLKPEVEVKLTEEDIKSKKDRQLEKALELIKQQ
ncbi:MAG: S41 family peptidase [bacterium]|nr:S41 family peptidase [bacterium]